MVLNERQGIRLPAFALPLEGGGHTADPTYLPPADPTTPQGEAQAKHTGFPELWFHFFFGSEF